MCVCMCVKVCWLIYSKMYVYIDQKNNKWQLDEIND